MAERARQINPELQIASFGEGISEGNLDTFLAGVDVCMDAIDFFELDIRRRLMARCAELRIPRLRGTPRHGRRLFGIQARRNEL